MRQLGTVVMGESMYLEIRVTSRSLRLLHVQLLTYDGNYIECIGASAQADAENYREPIIESRDPRKWIVFMEFLYEYFSP